MSYLQLSITRFLPPQETAAAINRDFLLQSFSAAQALDPVESLMEFFTRSSLVYFNGHSAAIQNALTQQHSYKILIMQIAL